jgi:hypothetical protein
MIKKQKEGVKHIALKLYADERISLEMAIWAMKNAGYTREETSKIFELENRQNIQTVGNRLQFGL